MSLKYNLLTSAAAWPVSCGVVAGVLGLAAAAAWTPDRVRCAPTRLAGADPSSQASGSAVNPVAATRALNPVAVKRPAPASQADNPVAVTRVACAACAPCAAACSPCAACTPCAAACAPCDPCAPCAAACAACAPCDPCAPGAAAATCCVVPSLQQAAACNPCAAQRPAAACNPCAAACAPCDPCAAACNPCAAQQVACAACAPCDPCAPCAAACAPCDPCAPCAAACAPCDPCAPAAAVDVPEDELQALYDCLKPLMLEAYAPGEHPAAGEWGDWEQFSTVAYISDTHGGRYVHNAVNATGAEEYGKYEDASQMPTGSVTVKPSFSVTPDGHSTLGPLFIMEKMESGWNEATADWRYGMINPDGSTFGVTGGPNSDGMMFCHECHTMGQDSDYMLFLPEEVRR